MVVVLVMQVEQVILPQLVLHKEIMVVLVQVVLVVVMEVVLEVDTVQ